ncbi:efflux RND transporter periplasmic adaptor subunit [Thalassomonas actiniarum]|uniref:Efflux RND transporter periplasmic adaptor subunit n=1 Tax=Thalassomonas actiniarum TaxID=485447 RepID=A0AAF0C5J3_9GAMM|nr:HlyD family efflux transporter periplasmic adaptor subunit [Thalassomonas actiniarum]WDE01064.1 efflux RND transporter periplasmic adaptor subunit [Thalassomonas actiniarum]
MKLKSIVTAMLIGQLALSGALSSQGVFAQSNPEAVKEAVEKGPNNGRMLRDGDFAIELAIFEDGVPPEFRVFATKAGKKVTAQDVGVNVKLTRLGDVIDDINFFVENDYLRGDMEIYEPHSFVVTLSASHKGKNYSWSYDNFEGRTAISDEMAQVMNIKTETAGSQMFNETLKVFGELKLAPNATRNVSARYPGEVKKLAAVLGQQVKKGQVLFTIESNESLQTYPVYAPVSGVITAQDIAVGEQTNNRSLLTITDTSILIAELGVFPMDKAKVKLGAPVKIFIPGSEQVINSQLFDALFALNDQQAKIFRAEVNNNNGELSVGQFVSAEISLASYSVPLAVKSSGLQAFRDFTVVYAKVGQQYEVRMLELGREAPPWVEVLGGLPQGTEYVAGNSYLIKADIDKSGASHDH